MTKFKIASLIIVFSGILFSSCNRHIAQIKEAKQDYYACPMHHDMIDTRPGKCPKCGMALVAFDLDNMKRNNSSSQPSSSGQGGHHH